MAGTNSSKMWVSVLAAVLAAGLLAAMAFASGDAETVFISLYLSLSPTKPKGGASPMAQKRASSS